MQTNNKKTTIQLTHDTKGKLDDIKAELESQGKNEQTYESAILELIENWHTTKNKDKNIIADQLCGLIDFGESTSTIMKRIRQESDSRFG